MRYTAKIGIGTAQWGMPYGIANRRGRPTCLHVERMLRTAAQHGISTLDTAPSYGEAEKIIGERDAVALGFHLITKTRSLGVNKITEEDVLTVIRTFYESQVLLRYAQLYGLLVHNANDLLAKEGSRLWDALVCLKHRNLVKKIGVSVYHPWQLEKILERYEIDIVQLPFSVYDQRFKREGLLRRLKTLKVEIHARSIFLQGLLLIPAAKLDSQFHQLRAHQSVLHHKCRRLGLTPLEACLCFCLEQKDIDKVIVGCENVQQLRQILRATNSGVFALNLKNLACLQIDEERIINPTKWFPVKRKEQKRSMVK